MSLGRALGRALDAVAVLAVVFTMATTTPLGGWLVGRARALLGRPEPPSELARWFRTGVPASTPGVAVRPEVLAARPDPAAPESVAAARVGLRPALARGVVVMAARGRADEAGHLAVVLPPGAAAALASLDEPPLAADASPAEVAAALVRATAGLSSSLGGEPPALAALVVGPRAVEDALVRSRALRDPAPLAWEGFGRHLGAAERRRAAPFVRGALALATAYELRSPLSARARVSSPFGPRNHPVLGRPRLHTGVDLAVGTGTEILAVGAGTVAHAGEDSVNGKFLRIDHGHGLTSAYCHASELGVAKRDVVAAGQVVALSGNTGRSTGPHLHFQLELDGVPVDPALFLGELRGPPSAAAPPP